MTKTPTAPGDMTFDLQKIIESKQALRKKVAAFPIAEKLRLLDALRGRALAIRSASAREEPNLHWHSERGNE